MCQNFARFCLDFIFLSCGFYMREQVNEDVKLVTNIRDAFLSFQDSLLRHKSVPLPCSDNLLQQVSLSLFLSCTRLATEPCVCAHSHRNA